MKKNTTLYILICSLLFIFTGCENEVDSIFSESSIERLEKQKKETREKLESAENGWLLEYYPDENAEGVNLFLKFNKSDEVEIACRHYMFNNVLVSDISLFRMISDYGPVLSFDTYNEVLHLFSDPGLKPEGVGFGGDYEFRIMDNTNDDTIVLRGKKRDIELVLTRFPSDITWEQYCDRVSGMDELLFTNADQTFSLQTSENSYIVICLEADAYGHYEHAFTFTKENAEIEDIPLRVPYVVTATGVSLVSPVTIDKHTFQRFQLNEEKTALISMEDPSIAFAGPNLGYYFYNSTKYWVIDPAEMSTGLKEVFDRLDTYFKNDYPKYTAKLVEVGIQQTNGIHQLVVKLISGRDPVIGRFNFNTQMQGKDQMSFLYENPESTNAEHMYQSSEDLRHFIDMISGVINIESDNPINPSDLKFIKNENSSIHFAVSTK